MKALVMTRQTRRLKSREGHSSAAYHALVRSAWLEWRLNASVRGVSPDHLEVDPPGWFAREELGFAFEHGPSLQWTLDTLATATARAVKLLGREAPFCLQRRLRETTATPTRR